MDSIDWISNFEKCHINQCKIMQEAVCNKVKQLNDYNVVIQDNYGQDIGNIRDTYH